MWGKNVIGGKGGGGGEGEQSAYVCVSSYSFYGSVSYVNWCVTL